MPRHGTFECISIKKNQDHPALLRFTLDIPFRQSSIRSPNISKQSTYDKQNTAALILNTELLNKRLFKAPNVEQ